MFKVGDIVKCISGQMHNGLVEGSMYKVTESWIERQEHFIKVRGLSKGFFQARFVKVNSFKGNK